MIPGNQTERKLESLNKFKYSNIQVSFTEYTVTRTHPKPTELNIKEFSAKVITLKISQRGAMKHPFDPPVWAEENWEPHMGLSKAVFKSADLPEFL